MKTELTLAALLTGLPCFAQVESNSQIPSVLGKDFVAVERISSLVRIEAILKKRDGKLMITELLPGSGAEQASLKAGDAITHINGKPVAPLELRNAVALIRGKPGTAIALKIERSGESPREVTITWNPTLIHPKP